MMFCGLGSLGEPRQSTRAADCRVDPEEEPLDAPVATAAPPLRPGVPGPVHPQGTTRLPAALLDVCLVPSCPARLTWCPHEPVLACLLSPLTLICLYPGVPGTVCLTHLSP